VSKVHLNFRHERQERKRLYNASIRIQTAMRKKLAKRELRKRKIEFKYACKLQAQWRRRKAQRFFKSLIQDLLVYSQRSEAALRIQCAFRVKRAIVARVRRVEVWNSVVCIQRCARAYLARTFVKRMKQRIHREKEKEYKEAARVAMYAQLREGIDVLQRAYTAISIKREMRAILLLQREFRRVLRRRKWKKVLCMRRPHILFGTSQSTKTSNILNFVMLSILR
jgi:hypothetical protein